MNILTISQDMYRDFGLAFPMIPTTFLCLFLCPQQTILNSESHYEVTEAFSVGVGGSHSGSQELGHLKTAAFAGARLFEAKAKDWSHRAFSVLPLHLAPQKAKTL